MRNQSSVVQLDDFAVALANKRALESLAHSVRLFIDHLYHRDSRQSLDGLAVYFGGIGIALGVGVDASEIPARTAALIFRGKVKVRHLTEVLTQDGEGRKAFENAVYQLQVLYHADAHFSANLIAIAKVAYDLEQFAAAVCRLATSDAPEMEVSSRVSFGRD